MYDLYENIRSLCKERGTNVSAMCLAVGVSKSIMSDLKNGRKKTLSSSTLEKFANFLGVSVDTLLGKGVTQEGKAVADDEIKFALFGGDKEITDEMFQEVKASVEFVKLKNKGKKD